MNNDDIVDAEIVEMTPAEEEWVTWSYSQDVETGGFCDCSHEGLGVSWHLDSCPGAAFALRCKVQQMMMDKVTARAARDALIAANENLQRRHAGAMAANTALTDAFLGDLSALADRLAVGNPYPSGGSYSAGYLAAVDTLRRAGRPTGDNP